MLSVEEAVRLGFVGGGGWLGLDGIMAGLDADVVFGSFFFDDASATVDVRCAAAMLPVEAARDGEEERLRRLRLRRMASNRESARRSRERKRRREEELERSLVALRAENLALAARLPAATRRALVAVADGARLRNEARALRRRLGEAQSGALALLGMSELLTPERRLISYLSGTNGGI